MTAATAPKFTLEQLRKEAEREVMLRKRVYPVRVADRRLTRAAAERRLALMQAIAELLREQEREKELLL
jgi:hypothetical protein